MSVDGEQLITISRDDKICIMHPKHYVGSYESICLNLYGHLKKDFCAREMITYINVTIGSINSNAFRVVDECLHDKASHLKKNLKRRCHNYKKKCSDSIFIKYKMNRLGGVLAQKFREYPTTE